jgi:hypothetical protein
MDAATEWNGQVGRKFREIQQNPDYFCGFPRRPTPFLLPDDGRRLWWRWIASVCPPNEAVESYVRIVDPNPIPGWESVRPHGSGGPVAAENLVNPPRRTSQPEEASQPEEEIPPPQADSAATQSFGDEGASGDEGADSESVADNCPGNAVRHSHLALDREGAPRITHRLVQKRRLSERRKLKTRILYVVGYLLAAGLLSCLIWQTYLAWY